MELCERLTTLGIAVNLVTYLTDTMHVGNAAAANEVTNFLGTSFMLCLVGGFVADSFLGRYLTIAIFTAIQACVINLTPIAAMILSSSQKKIVLKFQISNFKLMQGVTILTISTSIPGMHPAACKESGSVCARASGAQMGVLHLALYLTALGTGGLKSSVSGFGSDQFDESDKPEKKQMMKFFGWFFFFISIGSLLAVTVLVYIQDNVGRRWGYGICAVAIVAGLVLFMSGTGKYRFKKLVGSPITQIAAVVVGAWRKRAVELPSELAMLYDVGEGVVDGGGGEERLRKKSRGKQRLPHTKQLR